MMQGLNMGKSALVVVVSVVLTALLCVTGALSANLTSADSQTTLQRQRKKLHKQTYVPYTDAENVVTRASQTWGDFVQSAHKVPRSKPYLRSSVVKSLQQCTAPNAAPACKEALGDNFISTWKSRKVNGLCEENAVSKINCYDSTGKTRFCIFENAMMDFQKVRKRKTEGHTTRSWERGFLSADCGDLAPDDIGYLPLYKPDIDGREEAVCDFVFTEPVLAYSHENIRNFGAVSNDYLNVWSMLSLAGVSHLSRDVTFLNIDGIRRGKYFGDQPNQFFRTYNVTFRRILKASDFADARAKVCFKRLLMPPRPPVQFYSDSAMAAVGAAGAGGAASAGNCALGLEATGDAAGHDSPDAVHTYVAGISSLFQRWNLQTRQNYDLLRPDTLPTQSTMQVLLITRNPPSHGPNTTHILSRMYANTAQLTAALTTYVAGQNTLHPGVPTTLVVQDFLSISFTEQVRLIASSSVVVGMHGAGIASTQHMAVGTRHCCGVVEIFPEGEFKSTKGYKSLARRMGHHYARLSVAPQHTSLEGTYVPADAVVAALKSVTEKIAATGGSCFLPEVVSTPYL